MNGMTWTAVGLAVGCAIGAALAWLWLRGRDQALQAVLRERDGQLAEVRGALAREQGRVDAADQKAEAAQQALGQAKAVEAALQRDLEAERNLAQEKLATLRQAEERLKETFKAVAADTLKDNSGEFIKRAEERLKPFQETLTWIAAIARQHGLPVATRDAHFTHVPGLQTLTW